MDLIIDSSPWLVPVCFLAGALYAFLLYFRDRSISENGYWQFTLMWLFRSISVTMICLLLLSPMLRTSRTETEKPIIAIVQDNSASVYLSDSIFIKGSYTDTIDDLVKKLSSRFDIRYYLTGSSFKIGNTADYKDKSTDLSTIVPELNSRFGGRNLASVILASDGLYNSGLNPVYEYGKLLVPVHVIALGDTTVKRDVKVARVRHNNTALLGNSFPVEILINANDAKGEQLGFTLFEGDKVLLTKKLNINSESYSKPEIIYIDANSGGTHHYKIKLDVLDLEENIRNNYQDFFVDIIDKREKILVLANAPHPDISTLKDILETSLSYEVSRYLISDFNQDISKYDLVIFHNLPSARYPATGMFESLQKAGIPSFFILGSQTQLSILNFNIGGVTIEDNKNNTNEVQAILNPNFSLFSYESELYSQLVEYPPLTNPFGNYLPKQDVSILLRQKIGSVNTDMPLLYYSGSNTNRMAVLAGEGLWKWHLYEYRNGIKNPIVNSLILKSVQYLISTSQKEPFKIYLQNKYTESEPIIIEAELTNATGELVNDPDIQLTLTNESGDNFDFTFSRSNKNYILNAGIFEPGIYKYQTTVVLSGISYNKKGTFSITPLQAELSETVADHQLLNTIAMRSGGTMVYPGYVNTLASLLLNDEELKPISYSHKSLDDIINIKWIFALIMLLIGFEWFFRKRAGTY